VNAELVPHPKTPEPRIAAQLGVEVLAILNSDTDAEVRTGGYPDALVGKPIETASNTSWRL
jgi:hypothetical protein